ncbi:MAG: hypothetical protein H7Y13_00130 [Sphingobacteriaceae bacterium]|nr:hypothetical protein [Sphingobacteriaceae bacterium]
MKLDELKAAWQQYDVKLKSTQDLSNKIITSMISERSLSRLSKVKRTYFWGFTQMGFWLFIGIAILVGNPFDYKQVIEYVPVAIYCTCLAILILGMARVYLQMLKIDINHESLHKSLETIINLCEKPNKFFDRTIHLLIFSSTVLFPLSFLPRQILRSGWAEAIVGTLIAIAVSVTLIFIAYKLGVFEEQHAEKFKNDLKELDELKAISNELQREE